MSLGGVRAARSQSSVHRPPTGHSSKIFAFVTYSARGSSLAVSFVCLPRKESATCEDRPSPFRGVIGGGESSGALWQYCHGFRAALGIVDRMAVLPSSCPSG